MLAKLIGIVLIVIGGYFRHHRFSSRSSALYLESNLSPGQTRHRRYMYWDRLSLDQKRKLTEKSVLSQAKE